MFRFGHVSSTLNNTGSGSYIGSTPFVTFSICAVIPAPSIITPLNVLLASIATDCDAPIFPFPAIVTVDVPLTSSNVAVPVLFVVPFSVPCGVCRTTCAPGKGFPCWLYACTVKSCACIFCAYTKFPRSDIAVISNPRTIFLANVGIQDFFMFVSRLSMFFYGVSYLNTLRFLATS